MTVDFSARGSGAAVESATTDDGTIEFMQPAYTVLEGSGEVEIAIHKQGGSGATIKWRTKESENSHAAVEGVDYKGKEGTVHFEPDQSVQLIYIPIMDEDSIYKHASFIVEIFAEAPVPTSESSHAFCVVLALPGRFSSPF